MHGLIHVVWKEFIVHQYGHRLWDQALHAEALDESLILQLKQHEDEMTLGMMRACLSAAAANLEDCLEAFGAFFVRFAVRQGWHQWLQGMGNSWQEAAFPTACTAFACDICQEFIQNLNDMHHVLERDFRSARFPVFKSRQAGTSFYLTYSSSRFFPSLAKGIVTEISDALFDVHLELTEISREKTEVTWKVTERPSQRCSPDAGKAEFSSWSFFDFHKVMASLCKTFDCCEQDCKPSAEVVTADNCSEGTNMESPETDRDEMRNQYSTSVSTISMDDSLASQGESLPTLEKIRAKFGTEEHLLMWLGGQSPDTRLELARTLHREVRAGRVASSWYEIGITQYSSFWDPERRDDFYHWSESCQEEAPLQNHQGHSIMMYFQAITHRAPLRFVSHAWGSPQDWHEVMGKKCKYEDVKAAELCIAAKDIAAEYLQDANRWEEVRFWIDKCCIRQNEPEFMAVSIQLIEEFIQLCDGMVVILTWSYLQRLWCVYEWACFLVFHEPHDLVICAESLYRAGTEERFLESVRHFSVRSCQCSDPADRSVLRQKISEYYGCCENFERFLRVSVIAITVRCLAARAARNHLCIGKWISLAEELGLKELAAGLQKAAPQAWRQQAMEEQVSDMQFYIKAQSDTWFAEHMFPILAAERRRAVQRHIFRTMILRKETVRRALSDSNFKQPTLKAGRALRVRHKLAPATA
ncbi:unnamed protein product [Effrenium voratum]|uniref:Heme NO-binding domain-containing protein n=2 Tax=Effrenium voratum TaxID=2562239 RepID=A0AA36IWU4_9DINO|nr:unnamed protein product [Effrenium voratum]CAJ1430461.1 unnamed protein product [Effrenium voratum]